MNSLHAQLFFKLENSSSYFTPIFLYSRERERVREREREADQETCIKAKTDRMREEREAGLLGN